MRNIQAISVAETVTLRPDSVSQEPENAESQEVARVHERTRSRTFSSRSVHEASRMAARIRERGDS